MRVDFLVAVELGVVISSKVVELVAQENKVNGDEHRVSDCHSSAVLAPVRNKAGVLRAEERFLVTCYAIVNIFLMHLFSEFSIISVLGQLLLLPFGVAFNSYSILLVILINVIFYLVALDISTAWSSFKNTKKTWAIIHIIILIILASVGTISGLFQSVGVGMLLFCFVWGAVVLRIIVYFK